MTLIICGPSRGRYIKPIPVKGSKLRFVNDEYEEIPMPKKLGCEHPKHWEWGPGTRNGQRLNYPPEEMYWQKWHMTKKEVMEAAKQYDMFSLDMPGRILCKACAEREKL
jgi:hypothetical protein